LSSLLVVAAVWLLASAPYKTVRYVRRLYPECVINSKADIPIVLR
jgi:hypothetical protein